METWSHISQGKGFLSNEINSPTNSLLKGKHSSFAWESRNPTFCFPQNIKNQGIGELEFSELVENNLPHNSLSDVLSDKVDNGRILNPYGGEAESTSSLSYSVVESTGRDSLLIDLKLGRFNDQKRDVHGSEFSSNGIPILSSESSTPLKRQRASGANSKMVFCQVYGCNKDLSSSKDYHKRHKVCEIHSKTSKVIVNGIEQRFCQQCSRFHLLAEFDDVKRSCRKRLAGHNVRRRKPRVGFYAATAGRLLQSSNGNIFQGTALTKRSFICQEMLQSDLLHPENYRTNDWDKHIKDEDNNNYRSLSAIPITNANLHSKSLTLPYNIIQSQFLHFQNNGASNATLNMFNETASQYPLNVGGPYTGEHFRVFDSPLADQGLPGISDSGCAPSLLSSQSQNSSSHSSGIPMSPPFVLPELSEKVMGVSSQGFTGGISNKFDSSDMSAAGCNQDPLPTYEINDAVEFRVTNGLFQGADFENSRDHLLYEGNPTINLLQLSSQLQRVEHQRRAPMPSAASE